MSKTKTFDYDSATFKRSVSEAFNLYLQEQSSGLSIYMNNGSNLIVKNKKHEWQESQLSPQSWTVNGEVASGTYGTTVGTAANIVFDSTTGLVAGDIIRFVNASTEAPIGNLQLQIVSVTNGTTATAYIYGGTTDATVADNAIAKLISNPVEENRSSFTATNDWEPDWEYNYTEIFETTIELSGTALNSDSYQDVTTMRSQLEQGYYRIRQRMAEAAMFGRRVARSGSTTGTKGSLGGLQYFIDVSGGNTVDASSAALTPTLINNLGEEIKKDGGSFNTILCNYNQARKISAFNATGNNPVVSRGETTAGGYVMNFVSDLPVAGGLVSRIIVDEKVPANQVYLIDTNKIALIPMRNRALSILDGTINGQDGEKAILRGEYTLQLQDAKYSHGIIKNLAV